MESRRERLLEHRTRFTDADCDDDRDEGEDAYDWLQTDQTIEVPVPGVHVFASTCSVTWLGAVPGDSRLM